MGERLRENDSENNSEQPSKTIADLLPRYQEAYGNEERLHYEILRLIAVDGHDVAWMKYTGQVSSTNPEGEVVTHEYSGRELHCACDFTEGVGWGVTEHGQPHSIYRPRESCLPKEAAIHLRRMELRDEYLERFDNGEMFFGDETDLWEHIPEIILDMIEKGKDGEWLSESGSGAHDWGGYFYLQTVHDITQIPYEDLWNNVYRMLDNKQIRLEGMVVQEYYEEPPAPAPIWSEYDRYTYEGYTGIAHLPEHSKMPQHWQITILAPNGRIIVEGLEGPGLRYSPDFGADEADVASVEERIKEVIDGYLIDPMSQA